MDQEIPYSGELMSLVEHQRQRGYPVRYEFMVISGDDQHQIVILALRKEGPEDETGVPLVKHPNTDPLRMWFEGGYIRIMEGGIDRGNGVFRLTPLAAGLTRA